MGSTEPINGPHHHACTHEADFSDMRDRLDGHDAKIGGTFRESSGAREAAEQAREIGSKVLEEVMSIRSEIGKGFHAHTRECDIRHKPIERRLDRIEDHADVVRPPMQSIDYDGMSDTGIVRVTEALRVENARLQATIDATAKAEQRNSDRVRKADDRTWSKAAKLVAFVVSILTAAGGGAGLYKLLFGG